MPELESGGSSVLARRQRWWQTAWGKILLTAVPAFIAAAWAFVVYIDGKCEEDRKEKLEERKLKLAQCEQVVTLLSRLEHSANSSRDNEAYVGLLAKQGVVIWLERPITNALVAYQNLGGKPVTDDQRASDEIGRAKQKAVRLCNVSTSQVDACPMTRLSLYLNKRTGASSGQQ